MTRLSLPVMVLVLAGCSASPTQAPIKPSPVYAMGAGAVASLVCRQFISSPQAKSSAAAVLTPLSQVLAVNPSDGLAQLEALANTSSAVGYVWYAIKDSKAMGAIATAAEWEANYAPVAKAAVDACLAAVTS